MTSAILCSSVWALSLTTGWGSKDWAQVLHYPALPGLTLFVLTASASFFFFSFFFFFSTSVFKKYII